MKRFQKQRETNGVSKVLSKNWWTSDSITKVTHLEKPKSFGQRVHRVLWPNRIYPPEAVMIQFKITDNKINVTKGEL